MIFKKNSAVMGDKSLAKRKRLFEFIILTIAGTLIGVTIFGNAKSSIGPLQTVVSLQPTVSGGTIIELGPLGQIAFASHSGLVKVRIEVKSLAPEKASEIVVSSDKLDKITGSISDDFRDGFIKAAVKSSLAGAIFAFILVYLALRRFTLSLKASLLSLIISGAVALSAFLSYQPKAIQQPTYQGLVEAAPTLIGSAKDIAENFDKYRDQMTELLNNVTKLYTTGESLKSYSVPDGSIAVLHISDLHLNPQGWDMVKELTKNFKISMVIDTGDISDHGSTAEDPYLDEIANLKIPYIYIRGNHDSKHTESVIRNFPNAEVLDNEAVSVQGITFAGVGDPRFTPDKSVIEKKEDPEVALTARAFARYLKGSVTGRAINPDVILIHDPEMAKELEGISPLILAGHLHHRKTKILPDQSLLMVQGSTGGSGLRTLTNGEADPLQATILYFDPMTRKVIAWNDITMKGIGNAEITIARHLPEKNY